jgi:hypothetical protein
VKRVSQVKNLEDTILRNFYNKLRDKLQSHTFCTMFENARQFPEYPYTGLNITTVFGKGFQKRFRVGPESNIGYSVGVSNKINVYDLEKNEMVEELEFPRGQQCYSSGYCFLERRRRALCSCNFE